MEEKTALYEILGKSPLTEHGLNKRNIGFIVFEEHYKSHKELLHKIISAVGLDVENDVSIIELKTQNARVVLNELYRKSPCKHYFFFGLDVHQLSLQSDLKPHYPMVTENFVIHLSHSLEELATDVEKKKQLWAYLKKIFK